MDGLPAHEGARGLAGRPAREGVGGRGSAGGPTREGGGGAARQGCRRAGVGSGRNPRRLIP
jgi:hypothetical protein